MARQRFILENIQNIDLCTCYRDVVLITKLFQYTTFTINHSRLTVRLFPITRHSPLTFTTSTAVPAFYFSFFTFHFSFIPIHIDDPPSPSATYFFLFFAFRDDLQSSLFVLNPSGSEILQSSAFPIHSCLRSTRHSPLTIHYSLFNSSSGIIFFIFHYSLFIFPAFYFSFFTFHFSFVPIHLLIPYATTLPGYQPPP
jgi:hypothetical protein